MRPMPGTGSHVATGGRPINPPIHLPGISRRSALRAIALLCMLLPRIIVGQQAGELPDGEFLPQVRQRGTVSLSLDPFFECMSDHDDPPSSLRGLLSAITPDDCRNPR